MDNQGGQLSHLHLGFTFPLLLGEEQEKKDERNGVGQWTGPSEVVRWPSASIELDRMAWWPVPGPPGQV
ncbi:UNVERIFIED_CONTAM: hypothetical protein K2H54_034465 [Gekko kuhli]